MLRSLLFAPGDNDEILEKALDSDADGVILDLEDAVAPSAKDDARGTVRTFLDRHVDATATISVRMNALGSGGFVDAELVAHPAVDMVLVPMVETRREAWHTAEVIRQFEERDDVSPASLFVIVETARGIANVDEIAMAHDKIAVISFGLADYTTDANVKSTDDRSEVLFQRSLVVNAAAHAGVQAFDFATLETSELERVRADAKGARNMGYTGKAAIHPNQIQPIHDVFTPADEAVDRARKIVDEYEAAGEPGVLTIDGEMVDKPVVENAQQTLELADELDRRN